MENTTRADVLRTAVLSSAKQQRNLRSGTRLAAPRRRRFGSLSIVKEACYGACEDCADLVRTDGRAVKDPGEPARAGRGSRRAYGGWLYANQRSVCGDECALRSNQCTVRS